MKKFKDIITFVLMFISYMILSLYTHFYAKNIIDIGMYKFDTFKYKVIPFLFSASWILLFLLLLYLIRNKKKRLIIYNIFILLFNVLFVAQICYQGEMGKFMIFSDLFVAGEGLQYIGGVIANINKGMLFTSIISLIIAYIVYRINKNSLKERNPLNKRVIILLIAYIISFRLMAIFSLGKVDNSNTWKDNYNAKNIYNNFTNPNTSMYLTNFYEYNIRCIYKYIYNYVSFDEKTSKNIIDTYNKIYGINHNDNEYTGIFKDKNIIYIMMESIDSWVIDEETTPNIKRLQDEGLNFTNRYSPFFNGGQTINTEFSLNTGLYAISDKQTIYDLDDISYPYSLANMLKKNNYKVSSFHANTAKFYNRENFHKLLGYDEHYSALDMQKNNLLDSNVNYFQDSLLLDNKYFESVFNPKDTKYLSFFTTYSAHLEYTKYNRVYRTMNNKKNIFKNKYGEEETIYRTLVNDTDKAIGNLLAYLKKNDMLDKTVIVLVSDHYVYGYTDSNYVAFKKDTRNDRKLLQKTPFIIWSSDIEHKDIDKILDTADILPTVLNMMGIKYDSNKYMGTDVFSDNHDDFVWFSDGTYISDNYNDKTEEAILTKTNMNIKKNRNILLTNYYGKDEK